MELLHETTSSASPPAPAPAPAPSHGCPEYGAPVPWIGLYIAAATMVCFFCMTFDLVHGLIRKKPFLPCKLFQMSAFTMTVLAVATKIPVDLTGKMPRVEEQLSKLTGTALLCTSLGFYMPSLGTMGTSERYGNLAALSVTVITVTVNVCMQMGTCLISNFAVEHIIIMACMLVLLLMMWSSAIAVRGQTEFWPSYYRSRPSLDPNNAKDVKGLKKLLTKFHVLNYTGNPQTLICETSHHHIFGLLCTLSSAVVLEAMVRSIDGLKKMRWFSDDCESVQCSDYKWSIPLVIVTQVLTITVGTFVIIYRWLSFVSHTDKDDIWKHKDGHYFPERELEYLKMKSLTFWFPIKSLSIVFVVAKDFIMDVLIYIQILLYTCSSHFIGLPIYIFKKIILDYIFLCNFCHKQDNGTENNEDESEIRCEFVLSSSLGGTFESWMSKIAMKDTMRWTKTREKDHPIQLIKLISECDTSDFECEIIGKLEAAGENFFEWLKKQFSKGSKKDEKYEYRVSCISILVISGMLENLMISRSHKESREFLMKCLDESFEIIYYVEQKIKTPSMIDETRWILTKEVWLQWKNPNHWFRTKIDSPEYKSKESKNKVLKQAFHALGQKFGSLASKHKALVTTESLIISKFMAEAETNDDLDKKIDFLKKCFVEMIRFLLSKLPLAILKEIHGDDPTEIGEERMRKALKFLGKLELLSEVGDKIKWSWPDKLYLDAVGSAEGDDNA